MLFSEVYSVYYKAMSKLISKAIVEDLNLYKATDIVKSEAFCESFVFILENIQRENWFLLTKEFKTSIKCNPTFPLTTLQKRFLKTIEKDPRFKLFCDSKLPELDGIVPLYFENDLYYFDKINDGDPYDDQKYIKNFKKIMQGIKEKRKLKIAFRGSKGVFQKGIYTPRKIEFSEKDEKFRLLCQDNKSFSTINLARIISVEFDEEFSCLKTPPLKRKKRIVTLEITDERNALERAMLHFSHFEKQARKIDGTHYEVKLNYFLEDETEVLIHVLSFGPMIKVTSPENFINQIKERLNNQKSCE